MPYRTDFDIGAHHLVDVLVGQLGRHAGDAAAGVVDPDIDLIETCEGVVHDAVNICARRDVRDDDIRASMTAVRDGLERRPSSRDEYDRHPSAGDKLGGSRADAAARTRDDDDGVGHARSCSTKRPSAVETGRMNRG
jgi:hypothetical protein